MMGDLLQVFMLQTPLHISYQQYFKCLLTLFLTAAPGTPQHMDEQFLSELFLFVALVIMFWLLIA